MSLLGHIIVTETHGIRRFFYPVSLEVPSSLVDAAPGLRLTTAAGDLVPVQASPGATDPDRFARLDFAVSLAPFEKLELGLSTGLNGVADISDPLRTIVQEGEPAAVAAL